MFYLFEAMNYLGFYDFLFLLLERFSVVVVAILMNCEFFCCFGIRFSLGLCECGNFIFPFSFFFFFFCYYAIAIS